MSNTNRGKRAVRESPVADIQASNLPEPMAAARVLNVGDFEDWEDFLDAQGREYRESLYELVRSFGQDFIDFACAHAGQWSFIDSVPSDEQRKVVSDLVQISADLATIADPQNRRVATARKLNRYLEEYGTTRTVEWHRSCGGRVQQSEDDGSFDHAFKVLVRDLIGNRLLEPGTHVNVVLEHHPLYGDLFARLNAEDPLWSIFNSATLSEARSELEIPAEPRRSSALLPLWSDGTCQTLQFHDMIQALLTNTIVRKYSPNSVLEEVEQCAIEQLEQARRISAGEKVLVPTLVGLSGVKVADGVEEVGLEQVRLRRSTPLDPGCLNGTTQIWTIAEISTELYYLHNNRQDNSTDRSGFPRMRERDPDHTTTLSKIRSRQDTAIDRVCLAILLCSGGQQILATSEEYRVVANPMVHISARRSKLPHNNSAHEMSSYECMDFEDWVETLSQMPDHLNSLMRRLLRAARQFSDTERLLDAVTIWDALLGNYPDSIPSTATQIALLLEPTDEVAREKVAGELAKIYTIREDIVHGAIDPYDKRADQELAARFADIALRISIEAFRRLLNTPALAALPDARSRSNELSRSLGKRD